MIRPTDSKALYLGLATALAWLCSCAVQRDLESRLRSQVHESADGVLPYRIYEPPASAASGEPLPLVLLLHGAGERGDDNRRQLRHGVREFVSVAAQARHPCYLVAPQCPTGGWWMAAGNQASVIGLVEVLCKEYPVDRDRIYITGLSMGGSGTWSAISARPDLFAAALPICGAGDPSSVDRLVELPIWAFHGAADRVVPVEKSRAMIEALRATGGHPRYTEYPGVGHDSWTRTYAADEVLDWLFRQRRNRPAGRTEAPHEASRAK